MGKHLDLFTQYLGEEKKMSENTIQSYRRDLARLENYCNGLAIDDLTEVTQHNLESYIDYLEAGDFKTSTISRNVASIHAFYSYLYTCHEVETDVSRGLTSPKVERVDPDILTEDEVVRLLEAPSSEDPKGLRDKAMLEVMYATGIKVSELVKLRMQDVDLKTDMLIVNGRSIPLGRHARSAMIAYLESGRGKLFGEKESDILFPNYQGEAMSRQGFWKILKSYVKDAGIEGRYTLPSAPQLCDSSHRARCGYQECFDNAGTFRYINHSGLCPYGAELPEKNICRSSSQELSNKQLLLLRHGGGEPSPCFN